MGICCGQLDIDASHIVQAGGKDNSKLIQWSNVPKSPADLRVKIFADCADSAKISTLANRASIRGFTTNPTLLRKAGISNYEQFARQVLSAVGGRPVSFEVFADEPTSMERQARAIASWGENACVKVPVTNTLGRSTVPLIRSLSVDGIKINVTAVMTLEQVREICHAFSGETQSYVSVFAGRIADTGRDPVPLMRAAAELIHEFRNIELIWASAREFLNIVQADCVGSDIITVTPDLLAKMDLLNKDLKRYSLETVISFYRDAVASGLTLDI